ncbi:MAG TPA: hypothetical protein VG710_01435 [Opitutus sp.]|nr:hypothetical protein [Opitutus sp.]
MTLRKFLGLAAAFALTSILAHAADLAGHWTAEFDSQIGQQKYTYDFKADGDHLTGTAHYEHSMGKGESKLSDVKLDGDKVSFTENLHLNDFDLVVKYSGTIAGDEMKLTRQVGDIATEQVVANRAKPGEDKPAEKQKSPEV